MPDLGKQPPVPVTAETVLSWYRAANHGAHRSRHGVPDERNKDVLLIVRLVNAFRRQLQSPRNPARAASDAEELAKLHDVQKATKALRDALPPLLDILWRNDLGADVFARVLADLLITVDWAAQYIGDPPSQGGYQKSLWPDWAKALLEPVREGWRAAGRKQLSIKPDSPVVRVLCSALQAIDGHEHDGQKVASGLRWTRQSRPKRRRESGPKRSRV